MKHASRYFMLCWTLAWLSVALLPEIGQAEAKLTGLITLAVKGGEPVANVEILSEGVTAISDHFGSFGLIFQTKQPGSKVILTLQKEGLAVVNRMDLEQVLQLNPDYVAQFVLCAKAERDACAVRYYSSILEINFQQNYDARLKEIEANYQLARENAALKDDALRTKNEAIAKLAEENKSLAAQAQEWAKKFAELSLENTTDEMYKEALKLFQANKLDEALAVLDDAKIEAEEQQQIKAAQAQKANRYRHPTSIVSRLCIAGSSKIDIFFG